MGKVPRQAVRLVREHRPDDSPLIVGEFVPDDSGIQTNSGCERGLVPLAARDHRCCIT
jgi:hypothetical protein